MNFHATDIDETINNLHSSYQGLSSENAEKVLSMVGRNTLPQAKKRTIFSMIFEQLSSTLIIILIIAAVLSALLEDSSIDAIVIISIVCINTLIGVIQEYKTERTLDHLKNLITPQAHILRDGKNQIVGADLVVPGDILLIDEGEKIVADARIIVSNGLRVNQAILTGESVPQEKNIDILGENIPLSDRTNMLYQGTVVVGGSGKALVVNTGGTTKLGQISDLVGQIQEEINPFTEKLNNFSKKIAIVITLICLIVIGALLYEGGKFTESLLVSISLAVSAIPEGLPAVVALGLAFSTKRLLKKNVLVRKLTSSETLGRVTVICTDKTGTLTQSEMKVVDIYTDSILNPSLPNPLIFHTALLCNKAGIALDIHGNNKKYGDPTEIGLLESGTQFGYEKSTLIQEYPLIKEFPFDSKRKRMSVICSVEDQARVFVKGAPENMLILSKYEQRGEKYQELTSERRQELMSVFEQLAKEGKRVLAMAYKNISVKKEYSQDECESGLIFVGLMAMMDPPRKEVSDAIQKCKDAGIRVIMITGDSQLTAGAVGHMIGLGSNVIDATLLEHMTDEKLNEKIKTIDIFSRISPQDKLRIVQLLKKQGEIIAMTGDGVNDALALKQAHIGIAMGMRGTDVARDASDMVLLDDNFSSIVSAVEEGRRIYDNTKKFIQYLLACNFYEVVLLVVCILYFRDFAIIPFVAIQILWINLITDSFPALALSSQDTEGDVMKRKPMNESLLSGIMGYILWSGCIGFFVVGIIFYIFYDKNLVLAQTLAVTTSVIYQMLRALSCGRNSPFDLSVNIWLKGAVLFSLILHFGLLASPIASDFKFVSLWELETHHFVWMFGLSIIGYILGEIPKYKNIGK